MKFMKLSLFIPFLLTTLSITALDQKHKAAAAQAEHVDTAHAELKEAALAAQQKRGPATVCLDSAHIAFDSFITNKRPLEKYALLKDNKAKHESNEFFGIYERDNTDSCNNKTLNMLFNESLISQDFIFYIYFCGAHALVVRKISNGTQTHWRIYQSVAGLFTLAEWLGHKEWKIQNQTDLYKTYTALQQQYGNSKQLTKKEFEDFMQQLQTQFIDVASNPTYIAYFDYDAHKQAYEKAEQDKLALQHAQQIQYYATRIKTATALAGTVLTGYSIYKRKPLAAIASAATAVAGWLGATRIASWWATKK